MDKVVYNQLSARLKHSMTHESTFEELVKNLPNNRREHGEGFYLLIAGYLDLETDRFIDNFEDGWVWKQYFNKASFYEWCERRSNKWLADQVWPLVTNARKEKEAEDGEVIVGYAAVKLAGTGKGEYIFQSAFLSLARLGAA